MEQTSEDRLCQSVYEALTSAQTRFPLLSGKDRYALQLEILEWMSGEWSELEVDWCHYQLQDSSTDP
jgi:hypothetical protein